MSNRQLRRQQSQRGRQRGGSLRGTGSPRRPSTGGGGPSDFLSRPYIIGVSLLVLVLGAIVIFLALRDGGTDDATVAALEDAHAAFPEDLADGYSVGDPDAPVVLQSWVDFNCIHCLRFAANQEPTIVEEYVKAGKLRLEGLHLPILGNESVNAAIAAQCATDQGKYWDFASRLFIGQAQNERFSDSKLRDIADEVQLDMDAYDACYTDPATLAAVEEQIAAARAFGFNATPSFAINDRPLTAPPATDDGWRQIIDQVYEEATGGSGDATPDDGATETETPASGG